MRLFVTAIVLFSVSSAIAQTKVEDQSVPRPQAVTQAPTQRPRIRQTSLPGAGRASGNVKKMDIPPTATVVTLRGVCQDQQPKGACKTAISREDLDRYVNAFSPDASETVRSRMALQYARTLAFSSLAEKQGFDKNPVLAKEIETQLKLIRMRILATAYLQSLQDHTTGVVASDIEKYYGEHRDLYEQAHVRRLSVPAAVPTENGRPLDRSEVKAELDALRARVIAGEDVNELQQGVYQRLHIQAVPPPVSVITLRRSTVQGEETKAFDLNPGEVSAVIDSTAATVIIKLESKDLVPLESVRQEIETALRRDRMQSEVSKLSKSISAEFNEQYFGMQSQPDLFGLTAINPTVSRSSAR